MRVYTDANVLLSLFVQDAHTARVNHWLAAQPHVFILSDWTLAECRSVVGRKERNGEIGAQVAAVARRRLDWFRASRAEPLPLSPAAGRRCALLASDAALKPSTPDALHLALAVEANVALATLDERLARAATAIGLPTPVIG